jgi:hypothetical protein
MNDIWFLIGFCAAGLLYTFVLWLVLALAERADPGHD